eukprot:scaffold23219_cov131-Isochrysis_galbana.AAC.7
MGSATWSQILLRKRQHREACCFCRASDRAPEVSPATTAATSDLVTNMAASASAAALLWWRVVCRSIVAPQLLRRASSRDHGGSDMRARLHMSTGRPGWGWIEPFVSRLERFLPEPYDAALRDHPSPSAVLKGTAELGMVRRRAPSSRPRPRWHARLQHLREVCESASRPMLLEKRRREGTLSKKGTTTTRGPYISSAPSGSLLFLLRSNLGCSLAATPTGPPRHKRP